ncbi:hypothetical protein L195_g020494, partial [Trifolium pratense]
WNISSGGLQRMDAFDLIQMVLQKVDFMQAVEELLEAVMESGYVLARLRGVRKLELHIDSMVVVDSISNKEGIAAGLSLLDSIFRLLSLDWEVRISHSYREANGCALVQMP